MLWISCEKCMKKMNLHLWKNSAVFNGAKVCIEENRKGNNGLLVEISRGISMYKAQRGI